MAINRNPGFFLRCWNGSARLWQAYWLVGVIGQLFVILLLQLSDTLFWHGPQDNFWVKPAAAAVFIVWPIFSGVSIWRCAPNASMPAWGVSHVQFSSCR